LATLAGFDQDYRVLAVTGRDVLSAPKGPDLFGDYEQSAEMPGRIKLARAVNKLLNFAP
jgi:hypothetical protein